MKKTLYLLAVLALSAPLSLAGDEIIATNLPATITINISTNVINGDNASGCNLCFDAQGHWKGFVPAVVNYEPCKPYHPPTERWVITNVISRVTLTIAWRGKSLTHSEDTMLSSVTNRWKLSSEWKQE